jgi:hypothetical protein
MIPTIFLILRKYPSESGKCSHLSFFVFTQQSLPEETVSVGPCVCTCTGSGYNITSEELAARILHRKREATLDRKKLNVYYRSLTSATDERVSSRYLGSVGALILAVCFGVIFVSDSQRFWNCLLKVRHDQQLKIQRLQWLHFKLAKVDSSSYKYIHESWLPLRPFVRQVFAFSKPFDQLQSNENRWVKANLTKKWVVIFLLKG